MGMHFNFYYNSIQFYFLNIEKMNLCKNKGYLDNEPSGPRNGTSHNKKRSQEEVRTGRTGTMARYVFSIGPMDLGLSNADGVTMVEGENHGSDHTY